METDRQTPLLPKLTESLWLEETRELLANRPSRIKLKEIAADCGISIAWLSQLQTGKLLDAPISKVQSVNKWLKDRISHNNNAAV